MRTGVGLLVTQLLENERVVVWEALWPKPCWPPTTRAFGSCEAA